MLTAEEMTNCLREAAFRRRLPGPTVREAMTRANGRHNLARLELEQRSHDVVGAMAARLR